MIRPGPAFALSAALLTLAACGGESDAPRGPDGDEAQVLSEAAEMLPAATPVPGAEQADRAD